MPIFCMVYDALSVKEKRVPFFAHTPTFWNDLKVEDQNNEFDMLDPKYRSV